MARYVCIARDASLSAVAFAYATLFSVSARYCSHIALMQSKLFKTVVAEKSDQCCVPPVVKCAVVTTLCALQLSPDLMPDALHPNAKGMLLLAECIAPFVQTQASSGNQFT